MALTKNELDFYEETRLFFVTSSSVDNEEIFETLEDAREYIEATKFGATPRIWICMVKHAYQEDNGEWNYEDFNDTFTKVREIL